MFGERNGLLNSIGAGRIALLGAAVFLIGGCCHCEIESGGTPGDVVVVPRDNRPPVLKPIFARDGSQRLRVVSEGDVVTVRADAADPDGDALEYLWRPDGEAGSVDNESAQEVSWKVGKVGRLTVTVYDGHGGQASSYISISKENGIVFSGRIEDGEGKPLGNAEVEIDGNTTQSAEDGSFRLVIPDTRAPRFVMNIRKNGYGIMSRVVDNGVIDGSWQLRAGTVASFDPGQPISIQDSNSVNCRGSLSEQIDWAQFPAQRAAQVVAPNGDVIQGSPPDSVLDALAVLSSGTPCSPGIGLSIPANVLVDENGNPPPGNVSVAVTTVDIYAADEMPGDYTVRSPDGDRTFVMQSFGAGTVEVFDSTREYQLRPGSKARLTIPVDPTQRAISGKRRKGIPRAIPFLVYNEVRGEWQQIAQAPLAEGGAVYTAEVEHFSAFNSDLVKQEQACVRIDATAMTGPFKLEVTIPVDNAAPVVRTWDVGPDDSQPNEDIHAIYNLPTDTWIAMVPIRVATDGSLTPLGTFVVNTGDTQDPVDPNRPAYDFSACDGQVNLFEVSAANIVVDATGRRFGPLPSLVYALASESLGDNDFYPLVGTGLPNSVAVSLFGLYDTGSTRVRINNTTPYTFTGDPDNGLTCVLPHRLTDANWFGSDATFLGMSADATARVRLAGLDGSSSIFNTPDIEVPTVEVRLQSDLNVSLIGAPVTLRSVALIDYTSRLQVVDDFYPDLDDPANTGIPGFAIRTSFDGPDISVFAPNDAAIPFPQLFIPMERIGVPAVRWAIRTIEFREGAQAVDGSAPRNVMFDTGTTVTLIDSSVATGLGLAAGAGTFSCRGGTNNGYEIDAVIMTGPGGTYTVQNASVCWDTSLDGTFLNAVTGSSLFDQLPLLVDGPRDRIGIGTPVTNPLTWVNPPSVTCQ